MRLGFLVTARCNATCAHCTTNSGPRETAELPGDRIVSLMDEAAVIWRRERVRGEQLQFCISGGEPFLDFARLTAVVAHGARLGAKVTCVTNGYWASSDEKARAKLAALRQAGLYMLAVSTSRFHRQFVKLERVERALKLAREGGLRLGLKCAITAAEDRGPEGLEHWAREQDVDQLEVFPVVPYVRDDVVLPEADYIRSVRLPKGRCPGATITVREDGQAYTCCMPGAFTEFLTLGNVFETSLAEIDERFYLHGRQQVLRHRGPAHFARAVIAAGLGDRLRKRYAGVCDLCAHVASDSAMAAVADRSAQAFAEERFRAELDKLESRASASRTPARATEIF